jgi:hypothetical protein
MFVYLVYGKQSEDSKFFMSAIFSHRGEAQRRVEAFERLGLQAYIVTEEVLEEH